jgi:hypothetical protein
MFQEVEDPRIYRQQAHEGSKVVSLTHWSPLSPGDIPVLISIRSSVDPRTIVRPAGKVINTHYKYCCKVELNGGWDSVVGPATRKGLDGQGMEVHWGWDFRVFQTGPEAAQPFCIMGTGSFPGVKRPKLRVYHLPPSSIGLQMDWRYTTGSHLCLHRHVTG